MFKSLFALALLAILLLSTFAFAEDAIVLDQIIGAVGANQIVAGNEVTLIFRATFTGETGATSIQGIANGFRVYTTQSLAEPTVAGYFEAAVFDTLSISPNWGDCFEFAIMPQAFGVDGIGADTVGIGAVSLENNGFPIGFDQQVCYITTTAHSEGDFLCIDSSWIPPGGRWLWQGPPSGSYYPNWYGPYCFEVVASLSCGDIDGNGGEIIDIGDLTYLVDYMFNQGPASVVMAAANIDGSLDGVIDISDLVCLNDYMFNDGPAPECPDL